MTLSDIVEEREQLGDLRRRTAQFLPRDARLSVRPSVCNVDPEIDRVDRLSRSFQLESS